MQKDSCHQEGGSSELIQSKGRILERKLPAKERENSSSSQPAGKPCSRQFVIRFRTHFQLTLGSGDRYSETTLVGPGAEGGFKWHFSKDQQAPPRGGGGYHDRGGLKSDWPATGGSDQPGSHPGPKSAPSCDPGLVA